MAETPTQMLFDRPAEEDERRALIWLVDVRAHGGPLERLYAATIINTLAYFEGQEVVKGAP